MNKKCPSCNLINFAQTECCGRCGSDLLEFASTNNLDTNEDTSKKLDRAAIWILKRFASAVLIAAVILCGIYLSLLRSAKPLSAEQAAEVQNAVQYLSEKGFSREVFLLKNTVAFRASDNWLNTTTGHEDAYAATNFPFQIVTLYPSFFTKAADDTERAMILLHEAQHLQGADEEGAYEFVWRNRKKLGWTSDIYGNTKVWVSVSEATRQNAPKIFNCSFNQNSDCTE